jgi:CheY-like chemotaxis protein
MIEMRKVLLIDDDPNGADAVALYLQRSGFAVSRASNGVEAIAVLSGATPDLILLDVQMPRMDGVEFLAVLRSYLRWQHIPVILLTAHSDRPAVRRAAECDRADIVSKAGMDLAELVKLMNQRIVAPPPPPQALVGYLRGY